MSTFEWWRGGVIYQIYPRSFKDSDGDGIGDLTGIIEKLPYIASLGVDAIWLSPFFTSPMKDFGYDVADYRNVDPIFGTMEDFKTMLARAHEMELKVIIDQIYSHCSDQHAWFRESRRSRDNPKADWFVWADPKADGTPPNNWLSIFGGSAWQWDSRRRQYYLHNFLSSQPDLNFHNPEVQEAVLETAGFWLDLGVDGLRLDVVNMYFHDKELRDNPAVSNPEEQFVGAPEDNPWSYQYHCHQLTQPENLPFLKRLRTLMDQYEDRFTLGEIGAPQGLKVMAEYTSGGDKLHSSYTFELLGEQNSVPFIRQTIQAVEAHLNDGWPCFALSNHDVVRSVSRWGKGLDRVAYAKLSLAFLVNLRGSACIYQGEELGFEEAEVAFEDLQDPYGIEFWPEYKGRDGCRTPMVWDELGGFGSADKAWLPISAKHRAYAVSTQEQDENSVLNFVRQLLRWRKQYPALIAGSLDFDLGKLAEHEQVLVFRRSMEGQSSILVVLNFSDRAQQLELVLPGTLLDCFGFSANLEAGTLKLPALAAAFIQLQDT